MTPDTHTSPPKLPILLLRWFCRSAYVEDIEGDLVERFYRQVEQLGERKAKRRLYLEVFKLIRPNLVKTPSITQNFPQVDIFRNYFKTTIRSARHEISFTILTIICLVIGLSASIYVGLYTKHELSYDTFHEKADRIYRINQTFIWGERDELFGSTGPAIMGAVQAEIPEFEVMTRVITFNDALITVQSNNQSVVFEEGALRGADSTFFEVFTFPFIKGNQKIALNEPYSAVLTESAAMKYFGTTDILNEQLTIEDEDHKHSYLVTGVTKDIPSNSHITFDILVSMNSIQRLKWMSDSWWWTTFINFGVLRADANPAFVAEKLKQVPVKHLEPFLLKYMGMTYQEYIDSGKEWNLYLQPLLDVHLSGKEVFSRLNETGNIEMIITLDLIGLLILLLSIINFVNLTTARSSVRSKEVGVRKVIGTTKRALIFQFLFESLLFCFISIFISAALLLILEPYLSVISGKELPIGALLLDTAVIWGILAGMVLIATLAGIYPAFFLSSVEAVKVIKGQLVSGSKGSLIRRVLVTVQFAVSIALIASSLIIQKQVNHWLSMDLGFTRDNIIVVRNAERLEASVDTYKKEIANLPQVKSTSFSSDTPPYVKDDDGDFYLSGVEGPAQHLSFWTADEYFPEMYGLKIIAGTNFGPGNTENTMVVSKSLGEAYGITDPADLIGRRLKYYEYNSVIIGVFEDIQTEIRWEQRPIAIFYEDYVQAPWKHTGPGRELSVRLNDQLTAAQVNEVLVAMEERWSDFSSMPLKYEFLDEQYAAIFESSIEFGKLIRVYAIIAAIIAGLGLMGLVAYVIERRNKEIGIRKVLGAPISSLLLLLTSEFGRLLLIGFVIATGLAWYVMHQWQADFEYRETISPLTFLLAGVIMLLVVVLTLGYQSLKAASANPIKYLRDE